MYLEHGRIAQLGEHLPYKQRVIGSSPIVPTIFPDTVQGGALMWAHSSAGRASALQAEGHRFEPYCAHHIFFFQRIEKMILDLSTIVNVDGKKLDFDGQLDFSGINEQGVSFISPVSVCGRISNIGGSLELTATAKMQLRFECDRCLDSVDEEFECSFEEVLKKEDERVEGAENPDVLYFKGNSIELDEIIFNNIIVSIPLKHLCKTDCRGLCPNCGKNLNLGECDCDTRPTDPRFDILDKLFE